MSWPTGDPCPDCEEPMDVGAVGNPGETITWQSCEDCGIGWGPYTGFVPLEDDTNAITLERDWDHER